MNMTFDIFLDLAIERGIVSVQKNYRNSPEKLEAIRRGFDSCREKTPAQLDVILKEAKARTKAFTEANKEKLGADPWTNDEFWQLGGFEYSVQWVCGVVSAALANQGLPTIVPPGTTSRNIAADIVGVKEKVPTPDVPNENNGDNGDDNK